jgi:hypothetical protein
MSDADRVEHIGVVELRLPVAGPLPPLPALAELVDGRSLADFAARMSRCSAR